MKKKKIPCSSIRRQYYYSGNTTPIELQIQCNLYQNPSCLLLGRTDKLILEFIEKLKEPRIAKTILAKQNKVGVFILPVSKFPTNLQ